MSEDNLAGHNRFITRHYGDRLMKRVERLFIIEGAIIPPQPMSMRLLFAFLDPREMFDDYHFLYEVALEHIFMVVPTNAINELPVGDPTKEEFWQRYRDFCDFIMYKMMNGRRVPERFYEIFTTIMLARERKALVDTPCNDKKKQLATALASLMSRPLEMIAEALLEILSTKTKVC
jgi:hypothetical protein